MSLRYKSHDLDILPVPELNGFRMWSKLCEINYLVVFNIISKLFFHNIISHCGCCSTKQRLVLVQTKYPNWFPFWQAAKFQMGFSCSCHSTSYLLENEHQSWWNFHWPWWKQSWFLITGLKYKYNNLSWLTDVVQNECILLLLLPYC